ncbi:MAG: HAMP domain-containing histidine kinase [Phycisphaerae bacterium]|nr:HAMP domain-containing histidine kinase [Gemmatimonadaceae bacterium]
MNTKSATPTSTGATELVAGEPTRATSSLERRLPLMISGLLALTLFAFGFLAFSELRRSSIAAAKGQVRTVLLTTLEASARSVAQRLSALDLSAAQPIVVRAMMGEFATAPVALDSARKQQVRIVAPSPSASGTLDSALRALRARITPSDTSTLTGQLLIDAAGHRHEIIETRLGDLDKAMLDSAVTAATRRDSATIGSMFRSDSLLRYWLVTPVRAAGRISGYLAERRQLRASASTEKQIRDLMGLDVSVYYAALGSTLWAGIRGNPVEPKFDVNAVPDTFDLLSNDGQQLIGAKSTVRGIPLALVLAVEKDSVYQPANAFLKRMLMIGGTLLVLSIFGAWLVSRRVTEPLKSLTMAARQIARGNYSAREPVQTDDELGELAEAFNRMAQRIGESHSLLGVRVEESEALAVQLHQASQAKSEFLAMMSHELRTPLSAIAGYAEILQLGMRGKLNEAQQLDLSRIQANQVHLLRIINDILDLAQVESGKLQVSAQPLQVSDIVNDVEPIVLPLIAGRQIDYSVHPNVHAFEVSGERDRLTQVMVNLIANAVRFTDAGGSITVSGEERDGRVCIHVTDTGIGIAPDKQEAIFQPFVQAESGASRRAQGTGLGLAISRRIAEAMGGTLTVKSALGEGSTFTLDLESTAVRPAPHAAGDVAIARTSIAAHRPPALA